MNTGTFALGDKRPGKNRKHVDRNDNSYRVRLRRLTSELLKSKHYIPVYVSCKGCAIFSIQYDYIFIVIVTACLQINLIGAL